MAGAIWNFWLRSLGLGGVFDFSHFRIFCVGGKWVLQRCIVIGAGIFND